MYEGWPIGAGGGEEWGGHAIVNLVVFPYNPVDAFLLQDGRVDCL